MRWRAIVFALSCWFAFAFAREARAFEVTSDLSIGPGFLYRTTDVEGELCGGRLGVGGGYTMVSDFHDVRFGGQALVAVHGSWLSGTLTGSWGPSQQGRGWATLAPSGALHFELGRVTLDGELEITLRRADAATRRKIVAIDQLQLRAAIAILVDERWRAELIGLRSFYDPDLADRGLKHADAGLMVTMAGRPERWAIAARVGRSLPKKFGVEGGLGWVIYADGRGSALTPRAAIRAGPWRGFSVEVSGEVVVGVERAAREPVRGLAGLKLGYER